MQTFPNIGVDVAKDSGNKIGRRRLSKRGPAELYRLLFNAAMTATKSKADVDHRISARTALTLHHAGSIITIIMAPASYLVKVGRLNQVPVEVRPAAILQGID